MHHTCIDAFALDGNQVKLYRTKPASKVFRHWETWIGMLAALLVALVCSVVGTSFGHNVLGGIVGALIAGIILGTVKHHVAQRYFQQHLPSKTRR